MRAKNKVALAVELSIDLVNVNDLMCIQNLVKFSPYVLKICPGAETNIGHQLRAVTLL